MTDEIESTLSGRSMLCRLTRPLPIEAVVRGYLSGSGWKAYRDTSATASATVDLWGVELPSGLRESDLLPEPIFTPSTKAEAGHDMPMAQSEISGFIGDLAEPVRAAALALYKAAADFALMRGLIIADTKFEFGILPGASGGDPEDRHLLLIDEALTPDSSRFWDAATYAPGGPQASFDKQFVRDYLESVPGWNKQAPPPDLPDEIVQKTSAKYRDAYWRITGETL
jgi:phosphoribosylaminoimidazole-succinocarboxamide synthase